MMRGAEKELEKKRKKKGGSNGENLRELEKKRNCPFDAKKVCPVTPNVLVHPFLISTRQKRTNFFSVREKRKNKIIT